MSKTKKLLAAMVALAISIPTAGVIAPATASAAVGQGFSITPSDLAFILKQIKIAEAHVANPATSPTNLCGALVGTGPNQIPSPLVSQGLRTVDGSCNNLVAGQEKIGAADVVFPRLTTPVFSPAESNPPLFGPPASSSYAQKTGNVFDSQPRLISNLIVDQTSTNPAAIAAAGFPVRTQGNPGVVPCTTDPDPLAVPPVAAVPTDCTPSHETLFIPNVTTDVGLSPPYNSLFTLFGQFFDHGVDQTVKGGGTVFVPLKDDDPLIAGPDHIAGNGDDLPANLRFMVLTRAKNQPGPDGILGNADDVQDAINTDSPWVDQSQTYTSHSSHQVFLREYDRTAGPDGIANNADDRPVATGKLLGGILPAGAPATEDPGMATWESTKKQAAEVLGLQLTDKDAVDIPLLAADAYGNFLPGPNGLPQYVTATGLVEGNLTTPVAVPANAFHFETPFLTDIAHAAVPTASNGTPLTPDANSTAGGSLDPQATGEFDNELLDQHFIAGDGRVNENIGLTAIHQIFHSEHDRLVDDITTTLNQPANAALKASYQATSATTFELGERLFQAARFVTEMEYQHLVFEEFARKVQPAINPFEPFAFTQTDLNPAVRAEFAHAVYRFGHSMLTETISRSSTGPDNEFGTPDDRPGNNDISLLDGFLNPASYTDDGAGGRLTAQEAAGSIIMGMSDQVGNELDEFVTDTLRNNLLGLPLDLATVNMTRARSEGIPPLNVLRRQIFNATNDGALTPYSSWVDFGENLKHPESLINFVAAYGTHPTIVNATTAAAKRAEARQLVNPALGDLTVPLDASEFMNSTGAWANTGTNSITGLDKVDLWVGGLAEITTPFGGLLGTTFNYVFENQLTDLQNGDRLYYLARTPGMNLRTQLEGNSFAELMMRNSNVSTLKADAFATADCKFQLGNLAGTPAGFTQFGNTVADDLASDCREDLVLIRQPDGRIDYRQFNSVDPSGINAQAVYNGTNGVDRVRGGNDNDTFWGGLGNDVIEGGSGADVALGGEGDDIITDLAGDDVPKGGPGNDAIDAGPGLDILMGGEGKDFTNGGANANETFGGADDDFIYLGQGIDAAFGDSGDDWEEGGDQPDLLIGDSSNLFFQDDSQVPGHDILVGLGGDDDYDMEGGNDVGVAGQGIEKVAGASGYDFEIGHGESAAQDADLALPIPPLGILQVGVRDKFNEVEALSGWKFDDKLRGDDVVPAAVGGAGFIGCDVLDQAGIDMIAGLDPLLPTLSTPLADVVAAAASGECPILTGPNVWGSGNILLGGAGSDLIEGRGADDIIDGDKYFSVRLSVRNGAGTEIGSSSVENSLQSAMTTQYLRNPDGTFVAGSPTLQQSVFAGTVNPGNIVAVREILTGTGGTDTALFSGPQANYTITPVPADGTNLAAVSVVDNVGPDGTDTVRNVEILDFTDVDVTVAAPAAPTIGAATATNASATVSFTAPAGLLTGFTVEAVPASGPTVTALVTDETATTATVNGLTNGVVYQLRVAASNAFGTGAFSALSNTVTPTAPPAATAPGAPTAVSAVAGITSAVVSFTAPTSNGGSPITGFSVQPLVGGVATGTATAGTTSPITVTGLTAGTAYTFAVSASNSVGTGAASAPSNAVTPTAAPTAPAAPGIGTATAGNASATVNWTAPASNGSAISGYSVRVVTAAAPTVTVGALRPAGPTATSLVVTGLTNGTAYQFQVQATNGVGAGAFSALSNSVTPVAPPATAPGAPVIGAASALSATTITVRWTAPAPVAGATVTGYSVRVLNATNVQVGALRTAAAGATSLAVTVAAGQEYHFTVVANNGAVSGAASASSNTVNMVASAAPTIGAATAATNTTATVRWTAPAAVAGNAVTGYSVRVLNAGNVQIGALRGSAAGTTSLVVTGLTAGQTYHFRVTATNLSGTSAASASSNNVALVVSGRPTIGAATAASATTATVRWTAPAAIAGAPVTGYSVRVLNAANNQVGALRPAAAGATSLVVTGLTTAPVHFTVTATNAVGTSVASLSSNTLTLIAPGTPGIGVAVAGAAGGAITATANWTAPAANAGPAITGYQVVAVRLNAAGTVLSTTTSATLAATARTLSMTLPVAGNYRFSVRAVNIVGNSALSARSNLVAGR